MGLIVQGIPARHRAWAWPVICGARERRKQHMAQYFEAMVHMGESTSECTHQIELVGDPSCCLIRFAIPAQFATLP